MAWRVRTSSAPSRLRTAARSAQGGLEKRFGKKIETSVDVDPDLIGGATIVVGDTVIDGSVRGKLQAMATHLEPEVKLTQRRRATTAAKREEKSCS